MHESNETRNDTIPLGQRFLDSPFLLLLLGIVVMLLVYTGWGLFEVARLPQATLP